MAVKVKRDPDLAVAQPLARHLGVNAARKQVRGVGVAQVVEANARQAAIAGKKADPFLAEAVRAHGRAVLLRDHEIILRHALAELQQLLCFNSVSKVPDKAMVRPRPVFGSS